jgi:hypothetical protein
VRTGGGGGGGDGGDDGVCVAVRTDGDDVLATQRSAQDPILPNRHDLARRILRKVKFDVPLQLRGAWSVLSETKSAFAHSHIIERRWRERRKRRKGKTHSEAPETGVATRSEAYDLHLSLAGKTKPAIDKMIDPPRTEVGAYVD